MNDPATQEPTEAESPVDSPAVFREVLLRNCGHALDRGVGIDMVIDTLMSAAAGFMLQLAPGAGPKNFSEHARKTYVSTRIALQSIMKQEQR